jgi:ribonuclease HII
MQWIIGIDEVGRGPLAGPVCVCAVAMPATLYRKKRWRLGSSPLTDSKKMNASGRELWSNHARDLRDSESIRIGIAMRSARMIDQHGISASIRTCIVRALKQLDLDPAQCSVLLDGGLKAPVLYKKQTTVIRGDSIHPAISLASVVAKVRRDKLMRTLHKEHPNYRWEENKGYGTALHRSALRKYGPTPLHRKSFISKVI